MGLGPRADIEDILHKLISVYREVDDKETLMSEFYGIKQIQDEDVTASSCRLENEYNWTSCDSRCHIKGTI